MTCPKLLVTQLLCPRTCVTPCPLVRGWGVEALVLSVAGGYRADVWALVPHLYIALFHTKTEENRGSASESWPFPFPAPRHPTEINKREAGKCHLPWGPSLLPRDRCPWGAILRLPGGQTPPGTAQQQLCSPTGPGGRGRRGELGWLSPEGITAALGAPPPRTPRSMGPSALISFPWARCPSQALAPVAPGWEAKRGAGGGTVVVPPSLLILQLEADAAGLGPGQPWGCC